MFYVPFFKVGEDYLVYTGAAERFWATENVYAEAIQTYPGNSLPFNYPPFAAMVFYPLHAMGEPQGWIFYNLTNLAVLFWLLYLAFTRVVTEGAWK